MKKILNDLKLKFENPNWALDPEFALIDTVLEQHPELLEMVKGDIIGIGKDSDIGRQDSPTVEQIVRAALYKEMKKLEKGQRGHSNYALRLLLSLSRADPCTQH
ncbi:MAG: hypothetical protein A2Y97_10835 [Nitrospirae bacterium RBG_13_39_12]|nr:MAG: hypothetical protein A2Y97_10835 [Nitrospirae bacterium RBG_13_39_12]